MTTLDMQSRLGVRRIINAAGTYTPVGVSRSSSAVQAAAAAALGDFFLIDELQGSVGARLAAFAGAEAACITHCAAAGITLSIAAAMTGLDAEAVAALPQSSGLASTKVLLPAVHAVNYGHPITTDIRLAGATPVLVGESTRCSADAIAQALDEPGVACLLLVWSRLTQGEAIDFSAAVAMAHSRGVRVVIDGAAQDMRMHDLLATGADAVVLSGHKYLASPTAGIVLGRRDFIAAVRLQESGIGRAMKATKEALVGVDAALQERQGLDVAAWCLAHARKVDEFVAQAAQLPGLAASAVVDPVGVPLARVRLAVEAGPAAAAALDERLKAGSPSIWVMAHGLARGELMLELVPLNAAEIALVLERLADALHALPSG